MVGHGEVAGARPVAALLADHPELLMTSTANAVLHRESKTVQEIASVAG